LEDEFPNHQWSYANNLSIPESLGSISHIQRIKFVATIRHCPLGPCPPTAPHLEHITPSLARSARGSRLGTASWAYRVNSVNQYRTGKGQNHKLDDEADVYGYGNQ
jgi:hypothetical protein